MQLTKNNLLISIFAFILIVNLLVIFNLDYFYIRAILAFIFLITIPGLLIMLCLKIRNINFWEYLVYVIGLSVAFIMFAGLVVNWTLPWLHITDKPLSLYPILISFDVFLLILMTIASIKNKELIYNPKFPKFTWLDRIFIIIPMFFPILAVLGAFILNNNGPNYLTMIMLGGIALYVFFIVLFRDKLNENVYPWAILMIGLSLLFMTSFRGWNLSGHDIITENQMFKITTDNAYWDIKFPSHTYNACLSITILPTIFYLFLENSSKTIFELFFQIIFMFIIPIVFLIVRKNIEPFFAFIASFFFISQFSFLNGLSWIIRQEIALIFFGLMVLVLLSKEINPLTKKFLFVIFGFSMIVSHYSTTYIALALFLLTYVIIFFYEGWKNRKRKKEKKEVKKRSESFLTLGIILLLLIDGYFWYAQVTDTSQGLVNFFNKSISNMNVMFSKEMLTEPTSTIQQFNILKKSKNAPALLEDYTEEITLKYKNKSYKDLSSTSEYGGYKVNIRYSKIIPLTLNINIASKIYIFSEIIKKLIKIFMIIGVFYLLFLFVNKKIDLNLEYLIIMIVSLFFLGAMTMLPVLMDSEYSLSRVFQQVLVTLLIPLIFGSLFIFRICRLNKKRSILLLTLLIIIYFLFCTSFIPQIIGGYEAPIQLNNFGTYYDKYYTHNHEVISASWLNNNSNKESWIYIDKSTSLKFIEYEELRNGKIVNNILPWIINKNSYVYLGYTNLVEQKILNSYHGAIISFNFPTKFLNDNKNIIYNNGGSEIFK